MKNISDPHLRFASLFKNEQIQPYAYLLSLLLSEGHVCLPLKNIQEYIDESFPYKDFAHREEVFIDNADYFGENSAERKPFVIQNGNLYLHRYFCYEEIVYRRILKFLADESSVITERKKKLKTIQPFIKELFSEPESSEELSVEEKVNWQQTAALLAFINQFFILCGGPGTGKTTTVAKLMAILYTINPDEKIALAAPTGKAAMRMAESLRNSNIKVNEEINERFKNIEPLTLHRLLKYQKNSTQFKHNKDNPVFYDTVIIDESSMMDLALIAKLLDAISEQTRIVFLGDKNQLAAIEAGSIYGDLCDTPFEINTMQASTRSFINSFIENKNQNVPNEYEIVTTGHPLFEHLVELKRSRRFKSGEGIGKLSKGIISGNTSILKDFTNNKDKAILIDEEYDDKIFEDTVLKYRAYIEEDDISKALKKINSLKVLCAIKDSAEGVKEINKRIENILQRHKLIRAESTFYHNRPIIITSNNYNLGLFNGDIGIIRKDGENLLAWFESGNEIKSVLPGYILSFETVYAMTIHKSQGSEYETVLIILPKEKKHKLLTRELFYTGITRAKTKVIVQGSLEVCEEMTNKRVKRVSGLTDRMNQI